MPLHGRVICRATELPYGQVDCADDSFFNSTDPPSDVEVIRQFGEVAPDRAAVGNRVVLVDRRCGDAVPRSTRAGPSGTSATGLASRPAGYWHDGELIGRYSTIVAQFTLPDGRMATVHRTSLDPKQPAKAFIVSADGEVLPSKRNDVSALPLDGGAVRLMPPRDGEMGVAEGLENSYAAYMLFGVPAWYCLNRVLLSKFVVPAGLGIHTVHIFADFDQIDPKTGVSPGMADASSCRDGCVPKVLRP